MFGLIVLAAVASVAVVFVVLMVVNAGSVWLLATGLVI
jgi:hypothetical protein